MLNRSSFSGLVVIALVSTPWQAPAQKTRSATPRPPGPILAEVKKLLAADGQAGDHFGEYVAISGDTALVGAHLADTSSTDVGAAYVFLRNEGGSNNWGQVRKLQPEDPQVGGRFGRGAISGTTVVVGAFGSDGGAGAAYIFKRNEGGQNNWGQLKKLRASDAQPGDSFGAHTAISGRTALVGSWASDTAGVNAGAAYIFRRHRGGTDNWGQVKKLQPGDLQAGDEFGLKVAISGGTAVVAAGASDTGAGAAYIFRRNHGGKNNWGQVKRLQAADAQPGDRFGIGVAISGDTVVVGAFLEDSAGLDAGAAYVFQRHEGGRNNWGQVKKLQAADAHAKDQFGASTAIRGDTVVVGAYESGAGVGAAYVFKRNKGGKNNWGQVQRLQASDSQPDERFGVSAALTDDTALVGNFLSVNAEAVYVFSTLGEFDASGDATPAIDGILADSIQDGENLICTLVIASGSHGLDPKSRFRFHIGFGNSGFSANTTLTYLVKKSGRRCRGIPSLVCSEEEIDFDGNSDASCDGDVGGESAAACVITLRGDVRNITDQWLTACTGSVCLTPSAATRSTGRYDSYTFWSAKLGENLDRIPDTDDNRAPDSRTEIVLMTLKVGQSFQQTQGCAQR